MVGLAAGVFWTLAPGRADRIVQDDLKKVQHPLVVLLLLIAGARWAPSLAAVLVARAVSAAAAGGEGRRWLDGGVAALARFRGVVEKHTRRLFPSSPPTSRHS